MKRLIELLANNLTNSASCEKFCDAKKWWQLKFFRSPISMIGKDRIEGLTCSVNELSSTQQAIATDVTEDISCGLALVSVGYKGVNLDDSVPFIDKTGMIRNVCGKVMEKEGEIMTRTF